MNPWMLLYGGISGLIAAIPMSVTMGILFRMLPRPLRYAAPPREITMVMAEKTGLEEQVDDEPQATLATGLGHFGYSAFGGMVFAVTASQMQMHPLVKGSLFSLFFWAFGYLGWLPALNILRPATEHPTQRTIVMILAHLVWGTSLALAVERIQTMMNEREY